MKKTKQNEEKFSKKKEKSMKKNDVCQSRKGNKTWRMNVATVMKPHAKTRE